MVHNKTRISKQQAAAVGMLTSEAGLAAMHAVLAAQHAQREAVVGAASLGYWRSLLAGVHQLPHLYSALDIQPPQTQQALPPPVASAPAPPPAARTVPSHSSIEDTVRQLVAAVLGNDAADPDVPLASQGLDSLAGLELRQKIQVGAQCVCRTFQ